MPPSFSPLVKAAGWITALFLVMSCSLQAKVTFTPEGEAEVQSAVTLQNPARNAWNSLRDLDNSLPPDPLAPALWAKGLGSQGRITPTPGGIQASFRVAQPSKFLPGLALQDTQWDLTIDRTTLRSLAKLSAWADSPALDSLLPAPGAVVTETDYRDLLTYLLGPSLSDAAAQALVDKSTVELTLETPRPIVTAPGAVAVSGNQATFRWPLVKVLVLPSPLKVHVTF
jgi:hypothetical protein